MRLQLHFMRLRLDFVVVFTCRYFFVAANLFATFAVYCELIADATKRALYYLRPAQTQLQMHLHWGICI